MNKLRAGHGWREDPVRSAVGIPMVETFALADGAATRVRSSPDLADGVRRPSRGRLHDAAHLRRGRGSVPRRSRPPARGVIGRAPGPSAVASTAGRCARDAGRACCARRAIPSRASALTFAPPELFASVEAVRAAAREPLRGRRLVRDRAAAAREAAGQGHALPAPRPRAPTGTCPRARTRASSSADDGSLLEGLSSNVFAVVDGVLRTEDARVLHGTTRALVLELARGMVPVSLEALRKADLARATEVFLTSVSREVLGVVRVDDVTIGRGKPGALARELRRRYRARMRPVSRAPAAADRRARVLSGAPTSPPTCRSLPRPGSRAGTRCAP